MRALDELLRPPAKSTGNHAHIQAASAALALWKEKGHTVVLSPEQNLEKMPVPSRELLVSPVRKPLLITGLWFRDNEAGLLIAPCLEGLPDCDRGRHVLAMAITPFAPAVPFRLAPGDGPRAAAEWAEQAFGLQEATGATPLAAAAALALPGLWVLQKLQGDLAKQTWPAVPTRPYEQPGRTWWMPL